MFIIISYNTADDAHILTDYNGNNELFASEEKAKEYAKDNCAWNYCVVNLSK